MTVLDRTGRGIRTTGLVVLVAGLLASALALLSDALGLGTGGSGQGFGRNQIFLLVFGAIAVAVGALLLARPQIARRRISWWEGAERENAALAALVVVLGAVILFAGALETGVTYDEPAHVDRAMTWIRSGWYVGEGRLVDGRPDPDNDGASPHVYGPAFAALAHAANVVAGNEAIDGISRSADAYEVRHLTAAALGLVAIAAVGVGTSVLTRSRRFGIWAAAALIAIPQWTGQAFFNPKDTPVATGFTLVTVGLILALAEAPSGQAGRRRRGAIGGLLAAGFLIGAGTRLSLILPFVASLVAYALLRLAQARVGGLERERKTDVAVAAGAGAGLAAIAVLYPNVARAPLTLLVESVSGSADFPYGGSTLIAGQLVSSHPPWWYLPVAVGAALPLLLGGLAVLGAVLGIRTLVQARGRDWHGSLWSRPDLGLVLVLQQALLLPVGAVLSGAVMYNGMRQHTYILPAVAILAGVGAQRLWAWAVRRAGRWKGIAATLLSAALLVPIAELALLFPYNYAYVNPVAGIGGVNDRWETDYWYASAPEAVSRVPSGAELRCSDWLVLPGESVSASVLEGCGGEDWPSGAYEDRRGSAVEESWRADNAVWAVARRRAGNVPPDYCEELDNVTRWLRGEAVTMAYVLRCASYRAKVLGTGPSLYWPLTGTFQAEDQADGYNGTMVGATAGGFASSPITRESSSTDLGGTGQGILSRYLPFMNGRRITVAGWAYRDTATDADALFGGTAAGTAPYLYIAAGGNDIVFSPDNATTTTWTAAWPGTGQWVHWALVFNESTNNVALYINGRNVSTPTNTGQYAVANYFIVGARGADGSDPFDGKFAHVAVWDTGLDAAQINSLYAYAAVAGAEQRDRPPAAAGP
jgi:Concanavalin A-like lectin/glucanases superfamily